MGYFFQTSLLEKIVARKLSQNIKTQTHKDSDRRFCRALFCPLKIARKFSMKKSGVCE